MIYHSIRHFDLLCAYLYLDGFAWTDSSPLEYLFWDQNEPSDPEAAMHQDCVKVCHVIRIQ